MPTATLPRDDRVEGDNEEARRAATDENDPNARAAQLMPAEESRAISERNLAATGTVTISGDEAAAFAEYQRQLADKAAADRQDYELWKANQLAQTTAKSPDTAPNENPDIP